MPARRGRRQLVGPPEVMGASVAPGRCWATELAITASSSWLVGDAVAALTDSAWSSRPCGRRGDAIQEQRTGQPVSEPAAAGRWQQAASEWRVHFHVPVFLAALDPFESTQAFVREAQGIGD